MNHEREYKHSDITERIIGAFYDVHNVLGYGFLESVYRNALVIRLKKAGLKAEVEVPIKVHFDGQIIGDFRADILVENKVILELKAAREIDPAHIAQTLNYLRATQLEVALILNFGREPKIKRLYFDQ